MRDVFDFQRAARRPADDIERAFRKFDIDHNGSIDSGELRLALNSLGVESSSAGADEVMRRFDTSGDGSLQMREFRKLVEALREFHLARKEPEDDITRIFNKFDENNDKKIDESELNKALRELEVYANSTQTRAVMTRFDTNRSGGLDLSEFRALVIELRAYMQSRPMDEVELAFNRFDTDSSGDIDAYELRQVLTDLGIDTSTEQTMKVLRRYDADGSGLIELDEFRKLYAELKAYVGGGDDILATFRRFDADGSDDIDVSELRDALEHLGVSADGSQAKAVMRRYDGGSGALGLSEFRRLVTELREFQGDVASPRSPADDIKATFRRFDDDNSGDIDVSELRNALKHLGINADGSQARAVMRRYDGGTGSLKLPEFRRLVTELREFKGDAPSPRSPADDIKAAFRRFDDDNSGDIDVSELREALKYLGVKADSSQARAVMRRYDGGTGSLKLPEFRRLVTELRDFQGAHTSSPQSPVDDIKATFRRFDDDNSGDIDVSELRNALKHLGINADGSQARAVMRRYDGGTGSLKLPEFRRLVTELRQFKSQ